VLSEGGTDMAEVLTAPTGAMASKTFDRNTRNRLTTVPWQPAARYRGYRVFRGGGDSGVTQSTKEEMKKPT